MTKIGIITCENGSILCAGLNCYRALSQLSGTFARYVDGIEIVGFTTCGGCPGHLAKKKAESMIKYGAAEKIHLGCCIMFRSHPHPDKFSLEELVTYCAQQHTKRTRLNPDSLAIETAKAIKDGRYPHVCFFKEKIKRDIEMLGVEVIEGTHARNAVDIKE